MPSVSTDMFTPILLYPRARVAQCNMSRTSERLNYCAARDSQWEPHKRVVGKVDKVGMHKCALTKYSAFLTMTHLCLCEI